MGNVCKYTNTSHEVLLIDHLDEIKGKTTTIEEVCRTLRRRAFTDKGRDRLIICTFISESIAIDFANKMNYEIIFLKSVKPNLRIVKDKAKELDCKISKSQIRDFANLDDMFELRCEFRELEINEYMTHRLNKESKPYKLVLTSRGLNTYMGQDIIRRVYEKEKLEYGRIFLLTVPGYEVDEIVEKACKDLGFVDIYIAKNYEGKAIDEMPEVEAVFATEGNTFEVVEYARNNHFDEYIKRQVENGATYIGSSAGAIWAAGTFKEALNFDSNFIGMEDFTGLAIMPRDGELSDTVIPHYTFTQLKNYISAMTEEQVVGYQTIHNVANEEALILDCKKTENKVELLRKRRIRI